MTSLFIAVPLFMLAVVGLALGVLLQRKPLGGSCGNCTQCLVRKAES